MLGQRLAAALSTDLAHTEPMTNGSYVVHEHAHCGAASLPLTENVPGVRPVDHRLCLSPGAGRFPTKYRLPLEGPLHPYLAVSLAGW